MLVFYRELPVYNPQKTEGKPYKQTRRGDSSNYNEVGTLHWTTESDGKRFPKSVVSVPWDKEKLHPTQKPVALFEYLIRTYTDESATVLDNCLGSGTTAIACGNANRKCIGIELEEKYCEIAAQRCAADSADRLQRGEY
jgi:site-specific DNA-methyltransferase (adenine-specific)